MTLKRNNFVIAGLGSSGTKFLAHTMNRSQQWQVVHMGVVQSFDFDGTTPVAAQPLLDERPQFFGDVNGMLLFHLLELRVGRKAVIIRNPRDTLLSWYCDAKGRLAPSFFSIYAGGYFALDECIEAGIPCIRFERMVSDPDYLQRILRYFGIVDVDITEETLARKVNTKRNELCESYEAIDAMTRTRFERASGAFARNYYGGEPIHVDDFLDAAPDVEAVTFEPDRRPTQTRSTTLHGGEARKAETAVNLPIAPLADRLGLAVEGDPDAPWRLAQVQATEERLELVLVDRRNDRHLISIEKRTDGAPHFLRTAHLHISHRGTDCPEPLRAAIQRIAARLREDRLEDLISRQ